MSGHNVVAVWSQSDGSHYRIYSNYSADGGASWGSARLIDDNADGGYDPQIAMSGRNVIAVWRQSDGSAHRVYSNYSTDGGATWSSDQLIEDSVGYDGYHPQIAMSGRNAVAVWSQSDGSAQGIYSNYSTDGGNTWGAAQLIESNANDGSHPQVEVYGSNVVAVWRQSDGSYGRIYSNYSTDGGASWGSARLIEDNADDGYVPQVAMSGRNAVAVWFQSDGSHSRIYSNYSADGGAAWGTAQLIEDNASGGYGPQVAMSGRNVVAVWYQADDSGYRIYSNYSTDGGATWSSDQLIEDNARHGDGPQVAMSGRNVVAVWYQKHDGSDDRIYSNHATLPAAVSVGGKDDPTDRIGVIAPWIVLALAIVAASGGIYLVRRRAHSPSSQESKGMSGQFKCQRRRFAWRSMLLVLALVAAAVVIWRFVLPVPAISFVADSERIGAGSSSTLRWSVPRASAVSIDNGIGNVELTGTHSVSPIESTTYTLQARNAIGKRSTATVHITVIQLPVIDSFTGNPRTIVLGGESTLSWSVSGADAVTIDHTIGNVDLSGTRTVSPTRTTTYTLTASNEAGSRTASVEVAVPVVYDFVAQASHSLTVWRSGAGTLAFPGAGGDNRGFARYLTNAVLEDNRTYDRVLQTHPQWVDDGYIHGMYTRLSDLGYKVEVGDRFYAKVGLLKNATAGNVKFRVVVVVRDWEAGTSWQDWSAFKTLAEITDTYDGTLRTIDVDLSSYAGSSLDFHLVVLANGTSAQDWAVWVEAKIVR